MSLFTFAGLPMEGGDPRTLTNYTQDGGPATRLPQTGDTVNVLGADGRIDVCAIGEDAPAQVLLYGDWVCAAVASFYASQVRFMDSVTFQDGTNITEDFESVRMVLKGTCMVMVSGYIDMLVQENGGASYISNENIGGLTIHGIQGVETMYMAPAVAGANALVLDYNNAMTPILDLSTSNPDAQIVLKGTGLIFRCTGLNLKMSGSASFDNGVNWAYSAGMLPHTMRQGFN